MKRRKTYLYSFIAIIILLIIAISLFYFLPNYRISSDEAGNKVLSVKKGIGHFSFEIPSGFNLDEVEINDRDIISTKVYLLSQSSGEGLRSIISIYIFSYSSTDAASTATRDLKDARDYANFQLLSDLSMITVANTMAYQYTISYDFPKNPDIYPPTVAQEIDRKAYFDHNSYLWTLRILTHPSSREAEDMASFDRVLETFKVLE